MTAQNLKEWLAQEAPKINRVLKEEVEHLPASAQPIAKHILEAGGKRLRPLLVLLFARLLGNSEETIYHLASSMEMLHAATLLHDDVLDNADTRRGQPAAHTLFNTTKAILAGDALLAQGNALVASYNNPNLVECFSRATIQTASGEILEMDSLRDPKLSLEEYLEIAKGKTACLIAQSCRMGALAATASPEKVDKCAAFGENLGIAFQIVDDALDFAPQSQTGKPQGGDLREGKFTPPLYYYRQSLEPEARQRFDKAFSTSNFTPAELVRTCAACEGYIKDALSLADSYLERASEILRSLPDLPAKQILEQIIEYVRKRTH